MAPASDDREGRCTYRQPHTSWLSPRTSLSGWRRRPWSRTWPRCKAVASLNHLSSVAGRSQWRFSARYGAPAYRRGRLIDVALDEQPNIVGPLEPELLGRLQVAHGRLVLIAHDERQSYTGSDRSRNRAAASVSQYSVPGRPPTEEVCPTVGQISESLSFSLLRRRSIRSRIARGRANLTRRTSYRSRMRGSS